MFAGVLEPLGFEIRWHDADASEAPRGRHLQAVRCPQHATGGILLLGHTDTVLAPAMVPWEHNADTQKIQGSGVCDMKGGCVLMLHALATALHSSSSDSSPHSLHNTRIEVLFNACEEIAGPSFRKLVRQSASHAKVCLSFEPATLAADGVSEFVTARTGVSRFVLRCTGRASHAGMDHPHGVSAIREVARKIEQLEQITDHSKNLTLNVGMMHGGQASNQVADYAQATFGLRAFDADLHHAARDKVHAICTTPTVSSPRDHATTTLTLEEYASYPPWPESDNAQKLAQRYQALAKKHGHATRPIHSGGGADASHVADLLPVIDGLGILGGGLHQKNEWADLASFQPRSAAVADLLNELAGDNIV